MVTGVWKDTKSVIVERMTLNEVRISQLIKYKSHFIQTNKGYDGQRGNTEKIFVAYKFVIN